MIKESCSYCYFFANKKINQCYNLDELFERYSRDGECHRKPLLNLGLKLTNEFMLLCIFSENNSFEYILLSVFLVLINNLLHIKRFFTFSALYFFFFCDFAPFAFFTWTVKRTVKRREKNLCLFYCWLCWIRWNDYNQKLWSVKTRLNVGRELNIVNSAVISSTTISQAAAAAASFWTASLLVAKWQQQQ